LKPTSIANRCTRHTGTAGDVAVVEGPVDQGQGMGTDLWRMHRLMQDIEHARVAREWANFEKKPVG
jgi:hypothetical protein